jgi:tetratricopeptide (TPR) repeat protein
MFSGLEPRMQLYPRPAPDFSKVARRLTLDATVERMIANLGGQQKLGAVLGAAANSPRAIAAFWLFDAVGALKYSEAPARAEGDPDDSQPEIEINVTSEAEARQTAEAAAAAEAALGSATSEESSTTLTPAAEKMRAEVLDRLENLDSLDYYELLGIKRDTDTAALRKAYFSAAKRYHPDAIARLGLQAIRVEAGEVFARIAEANDTLSDDAKRRDYDTLLSGDGKGVDAAVLAQAETFYRKGEILLKMGNFRGALELLQSAVGLYPDECVYQSDLGWAYFKKNPPEIEPALKHLREALRLDPSDSVAKHRLGVIEAEAPPG